MHSEGRIPVSERSVCSATALCDAVLCSACDAQVVYGFDVLKLVSEQGNTNGEPKLAASYSHHLLTRGLFTRSSSQASRSSR